MKGNRITATNQYTNRTWNHWLFSRDHNRPKILRIQPTSQKTGKKKEYKRTERKVDSFLVEPTKDWDFWKTRPWWRSRKERSVYLIVVVASFSLWYNRARLTLGRRSGRVEKRLCVEDFLVVFLVGRLVEDGSFAARVSHDALGQTRLRDPTRKHWDCSRCSLLRRDTKSQVSSFS